MGRGNESSFTRYTYIDRFVFWRVFAFFLVLCFLDTALATGIDLSKEMGELRSIANEGRDVFTATLNLLEGMVLITDVAEARALVDAYFLEEYKEPADPESHVDEYFSVYDGNLPEVRDDVLRAWQYIKLAKEERRAAERTCPFLEKAASCIKITDRMIKHIVQGNKEAVSAGQSLNQLVMQDLKELEHRGANEFYYHGPAYRVYYNAAVELKERRRLKHFFDAMLFYSSMNEKLLRGKADVIWAMPKEGGIIQRIFGLHLEAIIKYPITYYKPYNKLLGYRDETGIKELLEFKQELVNAIKSMDEYYDEWFSRYDHKRKLGEATLDDINEDLTTITREELKLFDKEDILDHYQYALDELRKAKAQEMNASLLRDETQRDKYLALATAEIQSAYAKASRAASELDWVKTEWNGLINFARSKCLNSKLEERDWVAITINDKIKEHCDEGDSSKGVLAFRSYVQGIRDYNIAKSEMPVEDTRELLHELEILLEKAENDLDVSVEWDEYHSLIDRFEKAQTLPVEDMLIELVEINDGVLKLREQLIKKAKVEYHDLPELMLSFPDDKYSEVPVGISENIGRLSEMRNHYEQKIQSVPESLVRLTYEFNEPPACSQWVNTTIVVRVKNPFPEKTKDTKVWLDSIPSRVSLNNLSAYYNGSKLFVSIQEMQPKSFREFRLSAKTRPLECRDIKEKLVGRFDEYGLYLKQIELNALTDLPNVSVRFKGKLVNSSDGVVDGSMVKMFRLTKGKHTLTAYLIKKLNHALLDKENQTKIVKKRENTYETYEPAEKAIVKPSVELDGIESEELDYSRVNAALQAFKKAVDTDARVNVSTPLEYTERDFRYYRRLIDNAKSQKEINSLEEELSEVWNKLMHEAKREIEESKGIKTGEEYLDLAVKEYNEGFFNRAIVYARHARKLNESKIEQPKYITATSSIGTNDFILLSVFISITAVGVLVFRKSKKTKMQRILEKLDLSQSFRK